MPDTTHQRHGCKPGVQTAHCRVPSSKAPRLAYKYGCLPQGTCINWGPAVGFIGEWSFSANQRYQNVVRCFRRMPRVPWEWERDDSRHSIACNGHSNLTGIPSAITQTHSTNCDKLPYTQSVINPCIGCIEPLRGFDHPHQSQVRQLDF